MDLSQYDELLFLKRSKLFLVLTLLPEVFPESGFTGGLGRRLGRFFLFPRPNPLRLGALNFFRGSIGINNGALNLLPSEERLFFFLGGDNFLGGDSEMMRAINVSSSYA